jgi:hypothetical protein
MEGEKGPTCAIIKKIWKIVKLRPHIRMKG